MRSLLHQLNSPDDRRQPPPASIPPHTRARRSVSRLAIAAVLLGLLLATSAAGVLTYQRGKTLEASITAHLSSAQVELDAGKANLKAAATNRDPALLTVARSHFRLASNQFEQVSAAERGSALLRVGSAVPGVNFYVRPRAQAVAKVADLGIALSDAATRAADIDEMLLTPGSQGEDEGSAKLVGILQRAGPSLKTISAQLQRAAKDAAGIDLAVLPASQRTAFQSARVSIDKGIAGVNEFVTLLPVLFEILGVNGLRNYLVEQLNPAELRPGGGFIGTYSVMSANQGLLKIVTTGDVKLLDFPRPSTGQPNFVAPPGPLRQLIGNSSWSLEDSNFVPSFPSGAQTGQTFASAKLKYKLDGVLAIDFYAIASLLKLIGPMSVPGENVTLTSENLVAEIIRRDEVDPAHKEFLASIAAPLLTKMATLPANRWPELVAALNDVAINRHLQVFFNDPSAQAEMARIGWSGVINPAASTDFMMEVETNLSASKVNYWLRRDYVIGLTRVGDVLHHQVTIHLVNKIPIGFPGNYTCYVRFYVPAGVTITSSGLRANGSPYVEQLSSLRFQDGWIDMPAPSYATPAPEAQFSLTYDTPWKPKPDGQATIYWQKQSGTQADHLGVTWTEAGKTYSTAGDLSQDRIIRLNANGVFLDQGVAATAHLPSLSL